MGSDVFFGFLWQILFTNDNVLNPLSVFGACLVVSSIFALVFNKSVTPSGTDSAAASAGIELGTKVHGEGYSALPSELNDSEHLTEAKSLAFTKGKDTTIQDEDTVDVEEAKAKRYTSDKENLNATNTPRSVSSIRLMSPDTVDVVLGKESNVYMKDAYASLSDQ